MMRDAETILDISGQRGPRGLPVTEAYRRLDQRELDLRADGTLSRHPGAMTPGRTSETGAGMALEQIDALSDALRHQRSRWTPGRRTSGPNTHETWRPVGLPSWADTLLQEGIRSSVDADDEPQFRDRSQGFRPNRGGHTARHDVRPPGPAPQWGRAGDRCAGFDRLDPSVLEGIRPARVHAHRCLRLMRGRLKAGSLDEWTVNATDSGVPHGGVVSPMLSPRVLDRLDTDVATPRIPAYPSGHRRRMNPPDAR